MGTHRPLSPSPTLPATASALCLCSPAPAAAGQAGNGSGDASAAARALALRLVTAVPQLLLDSDDDFSRNSHVRLASLTLLTHCPQAGAQARAALEREPRLLGRLLYCDAGSARLGLAAWECEARRVLLGAGVSGGGAAPAAASARP